MAQFRITKKIAEDLANIAQRLKAREPITIDEAWRVLRDYDSRIKRAYASQFLRKRGIKRKIVRKKTYNPLAETSEPLTCEQRCKIRSLAYDLAMKHPKWTPKQIYEHIRKKHSFAKRDVIYRQVASARKS